MLLAVLSTWQRLSLRARRWLAASNLALVLYTASLVGSSRWQLYVLPGIALLGIALIFWTLVAGRRDGLPGGLIALGGLTIILSYFSVWSYYGVGAYKGVPWQARGDGIVFRSDFPRGISIAIVLLPALSLLGSTLLQVTADKRALANDKKRALWSILLSGLAPVGMLVVFLYPFKLQQPFIGACG
jgi:hypothetical protein